MFQMYSGVDFACCAFKIQEISIKLWLRFMLLPKTFGQTWNVKKPSPNTNDISGPNSAVT